MNSKRIFACLKMLNTAINLHKVSDNVEDYYPF